MADPTAYGCTDETFGFVKNLVSEEMAAGHIEVLNGAGVVKSHKYFHVKTRVSGTYIHQGDNAAWTGHVGDGTAITVTDTDIGGAATLFLESHTTRKGGSDAMAAMECDFVGWEYASLTV